MIQSLLCLTSQELEKLGRQQRDCMGEEAAQSCHSNILHERSTIARLQEGDTDLKIQKEKKLGKENKS